MNLPMLIEVSLELEFENDLNKLVALALGSGKDSITDRQFLTS